MQEIHEKIARFKRLKKWRRCQQWKQCKDPPKSLLEFACCQDAIEKSNATGWTMEAIEAQKDAPKAPEISESDAILSLKCQWSLHQHPFSIVDYLAVENELRKKI
uniref:Uncharacterized protein n=1 Tax=Romanomermis culicivorax TaxID=13658 RepID=A0A915L611_ROMCU